MILLLAGCTPDVSLPDYGGWPLWFPRDLTGATDLGHLPGPTPVGGPTTLRFVDDTVAAGLGDAVGGGNQHGVAIALVDVDADGDPDALFANGRGNRSGLRFESSFWRNEGGVFTAESEALGGALAGRDTFGVAAGDVDADGDVDLYVGAQPTNILLRNRGDGTFTDATAQSGAEATRSDPALVEDGRGKVVAIDDFDGDGALDLLSATSTQPRPGATLLHNRGDGTFEDWTERSGVRIAETGNPCAVLFTDYDNDGHRDLWIWNDRGGHLLLHHDGEAWEDFGTEADHVDIRNPMGIDAADVDRDGDLEYYVGNIGPHPLLDNLGNGNFIDLSRAAGTTGEFGWGLGFRDFDLDGWVDLLVAQEDRRSTAVYRNRADRTFARSDLDGPPLTDGSQVHNVPAAFADVDGDGRTDALLARTDGSRVQLLRNVTDVGRRSYLDVVVAEAPGTGARGGVGARVVVGVGGAVQFLDLHGGSSRASQSDLSARFGLDGWSGADFVVVAFPDGAVASYVNVPAGTLVVGEP